MGEHLPCTQGVKSSNLFISTKPIIEGWKISKKSFIIFQSFRRKQEKLRLVTVNNQTKLEQGIKMYLIKLNSYKYFQSRKQGHKVDALAHEGEKGRK